MCLHLIVVTIRAGVWTPASSFNLLGNLRSHASVNDLTGSQWELAYLFNRLSYHTIYALPIFLLACMAFL